jgi:hypothetical protein
LRPQAKPSGFASSVSGVRSCGRRTPFTWTGDRWECTCGQRWTAAEYHLLPDPERAVDTLAKHHYFAHAMPTGTTTTLAQLADASLA